MTQAEKQRQYLLLGLFALLGAVVFIGAVSGSARPGGSYSTFVGEEERLFPSLGGQLDQVDLIRVTVADLTYTLQRGETGWTLVESGGYPVVSAQVDGLLSGLSTLSLAEAKTQDPAKFERLGLADPRNGGSGALVELFIPPNKPVAALVTGRKGDRLYIRRPDEEQTWRARGDLPALYTRRAWMALDFIDMDADTVSSVRLEDAFGETLLLVRETGRNARTFKPGPPDQGERLRNSVVAIGPALALTRFAPIDVKRAGALETSAIAHHTTLTHDRLEVKVAAYRESDGFFVTLRAVEAGEGAGRAASINARAENWAFQISPFDWNDFTTPVADIVTRTSPEAIDPSPGSITVSDP